MVAKDHMKQFVTAHRQSTNMKPVSYTM